MEYKQPLEGIRILDLTQAMAGPMATMLLGDLGAEVIKIEPPSGDQTRAWAPPYINGVSSYFLSANRNKKSICLDLKSDGGLDVLKRMAKSADVIIENFRPGTLARLGLPYDVARELNPNIIYCSLSGYGQTGPNKDWPGYDLTVLANSGLLSLNGEEGRTPIKFGVPIADIISGMYADIAILSALYERTSSGKGQFIDSSMLDGNILTLTHQAFSFFATGRNPEKLGSAHASIAPYQAFRTEDSHIVITVGTEKLWKAFCDCIGRSDLSGDPRFASNTDRTEHRDALRMELEKTFSTMKTGDLFKKLMERGIPAAPINSVEEALNSEQARAREMVTSIDAPYGKIPMLGTPFKMSRTPGRIARAPPLLGGDNHEVLASSGFSDSEIKELMEKGVISARKEHQSPHS